MDKQHLITGATGLIGRHILFELLQRLLDGQDRARLLLLIRPSNGLTGAERLEQILMKEQLPRRLLEHSREEMLEQVQVIEGDISSRGEVESIRALLHDGQAHVIHCAAATTLSQTAHAEQVVIENNYEGTRNLLEGLDGCYEAFTFISSVYSCGVQQGLIGCSYLDQPVGSFRNPYERYKRLAELEVREHCGRRGVRWQILRPSITCGRLVEEPLYVTSKFDVFYGFLSFFHSLGQKDLDPIRIEHNPQSGLNIVPVDYVARSVVELLDQPDIEVNIAHSRTTPHAEWIPRAFGKIGYASFELVNAAPVEPNQAELLYYEKAGRAFTPYLVAPSHEFDVEPLLRLTGLEEPEVMGNIEPLVDYALKRGFRA